jgi:PelA/Pel-15E family pectate lyase
MISNGEFATLAQLVEHSPCKRTVVSSSLTGGSILFSLAFIAFLQLFTHTLLSAKEDGELRQTAETVLLYQRSSGGWPKGYDRSEKLSTERKKVVLGWRQKKEATIDNGATHTEIRLLAKAFQRLGDDRFSKAALRGIIYLLDAQYENGGWPQKYPNPTGYHQHVTFNDGAMTGALAVLAAVAKNEKDFSFVPDPIRLRCWKAVENGTEFILRSQVQIKGRMTVWCAQHDRKTLLPAGARSYELPSLSGSESVGIVRFLMSIENPDERVRASIESAVAWFEGAKLKGIRQVLVDAPGTPKGTDKKIIRDPNAPPLWGRFYDLKNEKPFFCSRDGIPRDSIDKISYERRNGYSWQGEYARDLIARDYPKWKKENAR